jgi:hypothetical protein
LERRDYHEYDGCCGSVALLRHGNKVAQVDWTIEAAVEQHMHTERAATGINMVAPAAVGHEGEPVPGSASTSGSAGPSSGPSGIAQTSAAPPLLPARLAVTDYKRRGGAGREER